MPKKRPNGDGSIYRVSDGTWRASISLGMTDGKRRRITRKADTREQARAKLRELQAATERPADGLTLTEYLRGWLDGHVKSNQAENTHSSYRLGVEHIERHAEKVRLDKVRPQHIENLFRSLEDAGVGSRSRQHVHMALRSALSRAVDLHLIRENPCAHVPRPRHTKGEIKPLSRTECRAVLRAVQKDRLEALYVVAVTTGMRIGELFGLQWGDVDFETGVIHVRRQAVECRGRISVKALKTKKSRRSIKLPQVAVDALLERRKFALLEKNAGCEWVFPGPTGAVMRRGNFCRRHWKPLLKRLKIEHRGAHHLRHTAASLLLGEGVPVHVVSRMLGHSRVSVTLDIYAHVLESQEDRAADVANRLFG